MCLVLSYNPYINKNTEVMSMNKKNFQTQPNDIFSSVMEKKISEALSTQLSGNFRMIVEPNGFHYGITYGQNGYYNRESLLDVDRTLTVDSETLRPIFSSQSFSSLYYKILEHSSYVYSTNDEKKLMNLEEQSEAYIIPILQQFESDFPNATLDPDQGKFSAIMDFLWAKYGDFKDIPVSHEKLRNLLMDYQNHAAEAYQMRLSALNANHRLAKIKENLLTPSEKNGGLQTDATSYYPGYRMPEYINLIRTLQNEKNQLSISLYLSDFSSESSHLSIEHEAGFIIPAPICVFGSSTTTTSLNSFTDKESTVQMNLIFPGLTTFSPKPLNVNISNSSGWYDLQIINDIAKKTGKTDQSGLKLVDDFFEIERLFGENKEFSYLKEYVISQVPTIEITFTDVEISRVESYFQHNSTLAIDFFGIGISTSNHRYQVDDIQQDLKTNSITVTLSSPLPSTAQTAQNAVAYVLGGVADYPGTLSVNAIFTVPAMLVKNNLYAESVVPISISIEEGEHSLVIPIPLENTDTSSETTAVLHYWYYYDKDNNTILVCDKESSKIDKTYLTLPNDKLALSDSFNTSLWDFCEQIIQELKNQGFSVGRYRELPEEYKNASIKQKDGKEISLSSSLMGIVELAKNTVFVNVLGTAGDSLYINGERVHGAWINLWETITRSRINLCSNADCNFSATDGAHIVLGCTTHQVAQEGMSVYILPLCHRCNMQNNNVMSLRADTPSLYLSFSRRT